MTKLVQIYQRLLFFLRREKLASELEEEMRLHLEMKVQDYLDAGMNPEEARYAALRQFGNITKLKEESREMWGFRSLEALIQDLRYGTRMIRKYPGFTAIAVLSLALGIGANTAIFSMIDAILLKMLPVKDPKELVLLEWHSGSKFPARSLIGNISIDGENGPSKSTSFSYPAFEQFRNQSGSFKNIFAFADVYQLNASIEGHAELIRGQVVSGNYYSGLGLNAQIGRIITDQDDKSAGSEPVAVLSYRFWQSRFGGDLSTIGKTIFLNGNPFTIIGVTPQKFSGTLDIGNSPDISVPMAMQAMVMPGGSLLNDLDTWWVQIMGRLKLEVTQQQATAELNVFLEQSVNSSKASEDGRDPVKVELLSGSKGLSDMRKYYSEPLFILMSVVGMVLLIACINVANLLLARAGSRQKEIAVRLALGASRGRLIRQLLAESLLLSVIGGVLGLLLAYGIKDILFTFLPSFQESLVINIDIDARILGFTLGISLLTGILFGLAPAYRATRLDLTPALKASAKVLGRERARFGLAKILVIAQVALSLLMLIGAGLFVRTLQNLENVDSGFNPENVLLFRIDPTLNGYKGDQLVNLYKQIIERIQTIPGVRSASMSQHTLISGSSWIADISVPDFTPKPGQKKYVYCNGVEANFFKTMEIPILSGRSIEDQDNEKSPRVAVINEAMARIYFPNENPIGKNFKFGKSDKGSPVEIIGISRDAKYTSLRAEAPPTIYVPYLQNLKMLGAISYEIRFSGDPAGTLAAIRQEVQEVDKNLPLFKVKTQIKQMEESITQERQFARLSGLFGLLALLLASIGLYGIMSYSVARRTSEIGIRMALGATRKDVIWMVMREVVLLTLIGVIIGIPASLAATKIISSMLFGLTPTDPITISLATLVIITVVAFAGYIPARRASKVDPMTALRYE
jgi:predicted permease